MIVEHGTIKIKKKKQFVLGDIDEDGGKKTNACHHKTTKYSMKQEKKVLKH